MRFLKKPAPVLNGEKEKFSKINNDYTSGENDRVSYVKAMRYKNPQHPPPPHQTPNENISIFFVLTALLDIRITSVNSTNNVSRRTTSGSNNNPHNNVNNMTTPNNLLHVFDQAI